MNRLRKLHTHITNTTRLVLCWFSNHRAKHTFREIKCMATVLCNINIRNNGDGSFTGCPVYQNRMMSVAIQWHCDCGKHVTGEYLGTLQ